MRSLTAVALLAAYLVLPRVGGAQAVTAAERVADVETVGTGERRVPPDRATVTLLIESKAVSAATAAAGNTRAVAAVRDTLRRLGLDSAATTASYNVSPDFEAVRTATPPRRIGYVARTTIRVALRQLDQVGRVIDGGLAAGATGVQGVYFEASTAEEARRSAMGDAAQAARRDAEAIARALGGSIGALLSVSTAGNSDPRRLNAEFGGYGGGGGGAGGFASTAPDITPSDIVVRAGVITRWQFVPAR
jgi:uncharacterized protein